MQTMQTMQTTQTAAKSKYERGRDTIFGRGLQAATADRDAVIESEAEADSSAAARIAKLQADGEALAVVFKLFPAEARVKICRQAMAESKATFEEFVGPLLTEEAPAEMLEVFSALCQQFVRDARAEVGQGDAAGT
ncbi:TPA_asm: hypothetical protein [Monoraphidium MELD virus]|nr:TPA_asm: hypothetical protein [Monoraphidium MELD virus]